VYIPHITHVCYTRLVSHAFCFDHADIIWWSLNYEASFYVFSLLRRSVNPRSHGKVIILCVPMRGFVNSKQDDIVF
jgi:hypothetical protein